MQIEVDFRQLTATARELTAITTALPSISVPAATGGGPSLAPALATACAAWVADAATLTRSTGEDAARITACVSDYHRADTDAADRLSLLSPVIPR